MSTSGFPNADEWHTKVLDSVGSKVSIGKYTLPSFPNAAIQTQFVGSAFEPSLAEAFAFYKYFLDMCTEDKSTDDFYEQGKLLDFGCGWGRFLRYFLRSFPDSSLFGVDVDPEILDICAETGVPGSLSLINSQGFLPYPDNFFSHVIAYSVFTHLPESEMLHWIKELNRVTKTRGILICTVEPLRFLDFIDNIPEDTTSEWHRALRREACDITTLRNSVENDGYAYIPTGGGGKFRDASVYGDTILSKNYITKMWAGYSVLQYLDDPARFWQAVVTLQKV